MNQIIPYQQHELNQSKTIAIPNSEPELNVPPKPNPPTKIRTTTSAASSIIREDSEEGNLILTLVGPRGLTVLKSEEHFKEANPSCVGAKTVLHTSSGDEFDYLSDDVIDENRLAFELWEK